MFKRLLLIALLLSPVAYSSTARADSRTFFPFISGSPSVEAELFAHKMQLFPNFVAIKVDLEEADDQASLWYTLPLRSSSKSRQPDNNNPSDAGNTSPSPVKTVNKASFLPGTLQNDDSHHHEDTDPEHTHVHQGGQCFALGCNGKPCQCEECREFAGDEIVKEKSVIAQSERVWQRDGHPDHIIYQLRARETTDRPLHDRNLIAELSQRRLEEAGPAEPMTLLHSLSGDALRFEYFQNAQEAETHVNKPDFNHISVTQLQDQSIVTYGVYSLFDSVQHVEEIGHLSIWTKGSAGYVRSSFILRDYCTVYVIPDNRILVTYYGRRTGRLYSRTGAAWSYRQVELPRFISLFSFPLTDDTLYHTPRLIIPLDLYDNLSTLTGQLETLLGHDNSPTPPVLTIPEDSDDSYSNYRRASVLEPASSRASSNNYQSSDESDDQEESSQSAGMYNVSVNGNIIVYTFREHGYRGAGFRYFFQRLSKQDDTLINTANIEAVCNQHRVLQDGSLLCIHIQHLELSVTYLPIDSSSERSSFMILPYSEAIIAILTDGRIATWVEDSSDSFLIWTFVDNQWTSAAITGINPTNRNTHCINSRLLVAVLPDGRLITAEDSVIRISMNRSGSWSTTLLYTVPPDGVVEQLHVSESGLLIAICEDGVMLIWDLSSG